MQLTKTRLCGARTRDGRTCRGYPRSGRNRCRMHGGSAGTGAPCGPRNGNWRHGKYSVVTYAERENAWREKQAASAAWAAKCPKIDYAKICRELERLRRERS